MLTVWRGTDAARLPDPRRIEMPPTIYVDRETLRQALNQAPENVKARGRAIVLDSDRALSDASWDDDPDGLWLLASRLADAAEDLGTTLKIPIDTEPYRSNFLALPIDLRDRVEEAHGGFGIPNFAYPGKWTVEHAKAIDALLSEAYADAGARMRRVHALLNEHGLDADEVRHEILGQITGDPERASSKAVTEPEVDCLEERLSLISMGLAEYVPGKGLVQSQTGEIFGRYAPDWRAFVKANGLTQKRLSELARERARVLKLPDPTKAVEITDPRLTAALMRAGRVDNAARAVEEAFAPEPEAPEAAQEAASDRRLSVVPNEPIEAPEASYGPLAGVSVQAEPVWWAPVPISRIEAVLKVLQG